MARRNSEPPPSFASAGNFEERAWDEERAARLVGKYALVGVAWERDGGEATAQYHGRIVSADRRSGIAVACEGAWAGETLVMPPELDWLRPAQPGEYRLKATSETVVSPDLVSTWRIAKNASADDGARS